MKFSWGSPLQYAQGNWSWATTLWCKHIFFSRCWSTLTVLYTRLRCNVISEIAFTLVLWLWHMCVTFGHKIQCNSVSCCWYKNWIWFFCCCCFYFYAFDAGCRCVSSVLRWGDTLNCSTCDPFGAAQENCLSFFLLIFDTDKRIRCGFRSTHNI